MAVLAPPEIADLPDSPEAPVFPDAMPTIARAQLARLSSSLAGPTKRGCHLGASVRSSGLLHTIPSLGRCFYTVAPITLDENKSLSSVGRMLLMFAQKYTKRVHEARLLSVERTLQNSNDFARTALQFSMISHRPQQRDGM